MIKRVKVHYYRIISSDKDYFVKFELAMEKCLSAESASEAFKIGAKETVYSWVAVDKGHLFEERHPCYFISIAKEKSVYPVTIADDGKQNDITDTVGDKYYLLICPALRCAVSLCGANIVKRFLMQFSAVYGGVEVSPYLYTDRSDEVLTWDAYRRIAFTLDAPTYEEAAKMKDRSNISEALTALSYSGALKMNLSLSIGERKGELSMSRVADMIRGLLAEPYCTALRVTGSQFKGEAVQTIDLKNDPVEFSASLELDGGHYLSDVEAEKALFGSISISAAAVLKECK